MGKWVKNQKPDTKFAPAAYKMNLYLDKASEAEYKKSGLKLKFKEDEDGKYLTLRRNEDKGKPFTFMKDSKDEFTGSIGNGSVLTVRVETYDTKSYGKGHRIEAIRVDKLVEYNPEGGTAPTKKPMPF